MTYKDKESAKNDLDFITEIITKLNDSDWHTQDEAKSMLNDWKNEIEAEANEKTMKTFEQELKELMLKHEARLRIETGRTIEFSYEKKDNTGTYHEEGNIATLIEEGIGFFYIEPHQI